jgi:hypothetical protein
VSVSLLTKRDGWKAVTVLIPFAYVPEPLSGHANEPRFMVLFAEFEIVPPPFPPPSRVNPSTGAQGPDPEGVGSSALVPAPRARRAAVALPPPTVARRVPPHQPEHRQVMMALR